MAEALPPTDIVEDNDNNTISFTLNPDYSASEHEYTTDTGQTFTDNTDNTIPIDDATNYQPSDIGVRVKAVAGGEFTEPASNNVECVRPWTPDQDSNAVLFINPMDESSIDDSTAATYAEKITDLMGNGYDFTSSGGARPRTGTRTENGVNVLDFSSSGMQAVDFPAMIGDKAMAFMILIDDVGVGNGAKYFGQQVGVSGRHYLEAQTSYQFGGGFNEIEETFQSGFNILAGYRNGTEVGVGYNGEYVTETQPFSQAVFTNLWLGCIGGNQAFMDGGVATLLLFDTYDEDIRIKVEGWAAHQASLQSKLPVGHLYKNKPPTSNTPSFVYSEDEFGNPIQDENGYYIMVEA